MEEKSNPAQKPTEPKVCGVCGDKALGYNFNAITCESCKAFFRRNALKNKEFRCPFNNNCNIDVVTRRFCQKCRLQRCFTIGMKKEWIMTDDEKKQKKQKIEENRMKRHVDGKPKLPSKSETRLLGASGSEIVKPQAWVTAMPQQATQLEAEVTVKQEDQQWEVEEEEDGSPVTKLQETIDSGSMTFIPPNSPTNQVVFSPEIAVVSDPSTKTTISSVVITSPENPLSETNISQEQDLSPISEPNTPILDDVDSPTKSDISVQVSHTSVIASVHPPVTCIATGSLPADTQLAMIDKSPLAATEGSDNTEEHFKAIETTLLNAGIFSRMSTMPESSLDSTDTMASVLNIAIQAEYSSVHLRTPGSNTQQLNEVEEAKLAELITANKSMQAPLDEDGPIKDTQDPSLISVINLTDIAIRRIIKMSKRISSFKNMCQQDQIALLKGSCTELMILRSVQFYDPDKDSWKVLQSLAQSHAQYKHIKLNILKEAGGSLYEVHQRFIQSFDPAWRQDENIMLIMSAISLFTPDRPNTLHKDVIKLEQDSYYYLLRRYLESMYSGCEARSAYLKLIHKIEQLHQLNENHIRVFLDVNPKEVEPLLIEIFDLKSHH